MRAWLAAALGLLPAVVLASCGPLQSRDDAERVAAGYFAAMERGDFERAAGYYAPRFYEQTPRAQRLAVLRNVDAKLGRLRSYALTSWNVTASAGTAGAGAYVTLAYAVRYAKASSRETLTLFKAQGADSFQIVGHQFNAPALLSG